MIKKLLTLHDTKCKESENGTRAKKKLAIGRKRSSVIIKKISQCEKIVRNTLHLKNGGILIQNVSYKSLKQIQIKELILVYNLQLLENVSISSTPNDGHVLKDTFFFSIHWCHLEMIFLSCKSLIMI